MWKLFKWTHWHQKPMKYNGSLVRATYEKSIGTFDRPTWHRSSLATFMGNSSAIFRQGQRSRKTQSWRKMSDPVCYSPEPREGWKSQSSMLSPDRQAQLLWAAEPAINHDIVHPVDISVHTLADMTLIEKLFVFVVSISLSECVWHWKSAAGYLFLSTYSTLFTQYCTNESFAKAFTFATLRL